MRNFWGHKMYLEGRIKRVTPGKTYGLLYHLPEGYPALINGNEIVKGEIIRKLEKIYRKQEGIDMSKKYFAYGSCTNPESFKGTMKKAGCENKFRICGVGILNDYRLAFTRCSSKWGGGVLDIIESPGDYVLGVVYEIPDEAVSAIDEREGAPTCYERKEGIKVELGFEEVEVFTYTVVDKEPDEIKPTEKYLEVVYKGMINHFPYEYINKYLIDHCKNRFGINYLKPLQNRLYHYYYDKNKREFIRDNPEFYDLLKKMALFFGDDNKKVETVRPTPEMFRLVVKCTEIAARDELDFGHMIPRGMYNRLASEFQRISGVRVKRLPE
ncbi:MAG TPA: gamma-glutamylcyclotransferase [Clostridiaceae bacterium]|nr:gamma-glutamylcyclotransferase [Clostridiaceae bacterium]